MAQENHLEVKSQQLAQPVLHWGVSLPLLVCLSSHWCASFSCVHGSGRVWHPHGLCRVMGSPFLVLSIIHPTCSATQRPVLSAPLVFLAFAMCLSEDLSLASRHRKKERIRRKTNQTIAHLPPCGSPQKCPRRLAYSMHHLIIIDLIK